MQDWLSIEEIARLWADETGESANVLEQDLEAWFQDFVKRKPSGASKASDSDNDTTDLLMGMLGGRHLRKRTFEAYCEERGFNKPSFWFEDEITEQLSAPNVTSFPLLMETLQDELQHDDAVEQIEGMPPAFETEDEEFDHPEMADQQYENGVDHQFENGVDHQFENGVDHQFENGADQQFENGADQQYESGADHQFENGADHQYENGADHQFQNGRDADAEFETDPRAAELSSPEAPQTSEPWPVETETDPVEDAEVAQDELHETAHDTFGESEWPQEDDPEPVEEVVHETAPDTFEESEWPQEDEPEPVEEVVHETAPDAFEESEAAQEPEAEYFEDEETEPEQDVFLMADLPPVKNGKDTVAPIQQQGQEDPLASKFLPEEFRAAEFERLKAESLKSSLIDGPASETKPFESISAARPLDSQPSTGAWDSLGSSLEDNDLAQTLSQQDSNPPPEWPGADTPPKQPWWARTSVRIAAAFFLTLPIIVAVLLFWPDILELKGTDSQSASLSQLGSATSAPSDPAALVALKAEVAAARDQIAGLSSALETSNSEVDRLNSDLLAVQQSSNAAGGTGASETDAAQKRLVQAAVSASAESVSLKAELTTAREEIARFKAEARAAKTQVASLSGELTKARQAREASLAKTAAADDSKHQGLMLALQEASDRAAQRKTELGTAWQKIANLEAQVEIAESKSVRLNSELTEARSAITAVQQEAEAQAEVKRKELMATIEAASAQEARTKKELEKAKQNSSRIEASLRAADNKVTRLESELAQARSAIVSAQKEARAKAEAERVAITGKAEAERLTAAAKAESKRLVEAAKAESKRLVAATETKLEKLSTALKAASGEAAGRKTELNNALQQVAGLETKVQAAEARSVHLNRELANVRQTMQKTVADAESKRKELVLALQVASVEAARRKQELEAVQQRLAGLDAVLDSFDAEAARLAQQLEGAQAALDAARKRKAQSEANLGTPNASGDSQLSETAGEAALTQ